jgi:hypothetical protein
MVFFLKLRAELSGDAGISIVLNDAKNNLNIFGLFGVF